MVDFETDVYIVGTGPTGSALALALATYGIRTHLISRFRWLSNSPRAHITNQRAMEVFRDLGVADELARYGSKWDVMGDTVIATSLAGEEISRIRTWGTGDDRHGEYLAASPCPMLDVAQPHMELVLLQAAASRGANVSFNTEYLHHEQDDSGVTVTVLDRLSHREYSVRAKYLFAADGARSQIANDIELPIVGEMGRANTAYVQFSADLSQYVSHRPSILHWIMSPNANFGEIGMGLLRAVRPWDQWIAGWGYDPEMGDPDFSIPSLIARIRQLVGDSELEVEIGPTSTWQVNQAYATTLSRGRVFCGGDAIHRHPPSGGLGSNTCVQDAFNIAWKLAFVLRGHAGTTLLDSYTAERAPVGKEIVDRANKSRREFGPIRDAIYSGLSSNSTEDIMGVLWAPGPEGVKRREALAKAMEMKDYEFNAQGVELNQRYVSNAVINEVSNDEETWLQDKELYLQATTLPGAKLPHAWLVNERGHRISTLDLVGKGSFTLVTGIAGQAWVAAVHQLNHPYLRAVVFGASGARDAYGYWQRIRDIDEGGALLVRPDGYIAWRHRSPQFDAPNATTILEDALASILSQN